MLNDSDVVRLLKRCDDERVFVVYEALKRGIELAKIHNITKIDKWFLAKLQNLVKMERKLVKKELTPELYLEAKKMGFLDKTIVRLSGEDAPEKRFASYKMVDTCAAEFKAETPYFYSTFDEENEAAEFLQEHDSGKKKIIVFGSGPIRIGQGIEFDYCSVHCVWALKEEGYEAIIVNNNPETVSTDFDTSDRLYFDPLTPEDVDSIIETEKPWGAIVQFGGQTAIGLTKHLEESGVHILGTSAKSIDEAEDRESFDELLQRCEIPRPEGKTVFQLDEALKAAKNLGYPVLLRPSYVLGGQNMIIAYSDADVEEYMNIILASGIENPVLIDKYMMGIEVEVDAICDGTDYLIPGIMEHIERAGIHSGDSISVYPAQRLTEENKKTIVEYTGRLARELHVIGLMNIQYVVHNGEVYVIEVNPRSSRTVPYISKVTNVPMVDLATKIMLGATLKGMGYETGVHPVGDYVAVKVPVFSFEKLHSVDTMLGPEMKSTGEVLGIAKSFDEALYKGLIAAGYQIKHEGGVLISVRDKDKEEIFSIAKKLEKMGFKLYGTKGTAAYLNNYGLHVEPVNKISEPGKNNILDLLESGKVDYVISTSTKGRQPAREGVRIRRKAVERSIACLTAIDTAKVLVDCISMNKSIQDVELVDITQI